TASKADVDFHAAITASTHNAYLVAFSSFIEGQLLTAREIGWKNSAKLTDGPRPAQVEHQLLFQAIHAKDPERARQAAAA
ncbi:FCD domain-containing protein, partial [Cupriavidus sp. SIMBA_020]|uniref:FCD domain-containing protein n=1 Tax=Cupriavidus sp. SIMBA_020 TaxID=3085766 RepID=UPI003978477E